jgi:hypothetical protein
MAAPETPTSLAMLKMGVLASFTKVLMIVLSIPSIFLLQHYWIKIKKIENTNCILYFFTLR